MMLSLLAVLTTSPCPSGWTGGAGTTKCMKLAESATHERCAAVCGSVGGSLACIQSASQDAVATMVSPTAIENNAWVGEYQWRFEQELTVGKQCPAAGTCLANMYAGVPYNGQSGWGTCSNGQATNFTPLALGFLQPNNYNAGEDCISKSATAGYYDDVCTRELPCLCEWGSPPPGCAHGC